MDFACIWCGSWEKCRKRQRTGKKMGHLMAKASEYCKALIQSSQLAINFILFSAFPFAEYIVSGISPDIWCSTMLNMLRNQFPDISVWVPNVSRMFWPESLCVSVSHLLNRHSNILSSYRVLLKEINIVKHSYAMLIKALEKLTRKSAIVSSKQVLDTLW